MTSDNRERAKREINQASKYPIGQMVDNAPAIDLLTAAYDSRDLAIAELEAKLGEARRQGIQDAWDSINKWIVQGALEHDANERRNGMVLAANQVIQLFDQTDKIEPAEGNTHIIGGQK